PPRAVAARTIRTCRAARLACAALRADGKSDARFRDLGGLHHDDARSVGGLVLRRLRGNDELVLPRLDVGPRPGPAARAFLVLDDVALRSVQGGGEREVFRLVRILDRGLDRAGLRHGLLRLLA